MTRRVAVFGGSFDPPHVCHVLATAWALSVGDIDEVWWVPAWSHAFDKELTAWEARFEMCQAAVSVFGGHVSVCDIERTLGGTSRTWNTLVALESRHPDTRFVLLMGGDLVGTLSRWYRGDELAARWPIMVVGRAGHDAAHATELSLPDVSSSEIRAAVRAGAHADIATWMPVDVAAIVARDGLYQASEP